MFQSMNKTLQRRQDNLKTHSSVSVLVREAVQTYIRENYPDAVLSVTVRYDERDKLVVINTPSKALAGELMLNTRELRAHLAAHRVTVSRIIAR